MQRLIFLSLRFSLHKNCSIIQKKVKNILIAKINSPPKEGPSPFFVEIDLTAYADIGYYC